MMQVTPAPDNAGTHQQAAIHHRAVPCQPRRSLLPPGQPYERTIGADLFQLGSLGQAQTRKPQLPQIPIPKNSN